MFRREGSPKLPLLPENIRISRHALELIDSLVLLEDCVWHARISKWVIKVRIHITGRNKWIPASSEWYIVIDNSYPLGEIKVYPSAHNGITATFQHQADNSGLDENGLWRTGALCLDVNVKSLNFRMGDPEPTNCKDRLAWHAARAVYWVKAAANNELVKRGDNYEFPYIAYSVPLHIAYFEDEISFLIWADADKKLGIASFLCSEDDKTILYASEFLSTKQHLQHSNPWGKHILTHCHDAIKGIWIMLKSIPVTNVWQIPSTFGELTSVCKSQGVNLMNELKALTASFQDNDRHVLMLGFPAPEHIGEEASQIAWLALLMPELSMPNEQPKGFRNSLNSLWKWKRMRYLGVNTKVDWIETSNWGPRQISARGCLCSSLKRKRVLIIGAGCIGSAVSEMLVRAGITQVAIADKDLFEKGNLARHTLTLDDIGFNKAERLEARLNRLSPYVHASAITRYIALDNDGKCNDDLSRYDCIVDCTGSNEILNVLSTCVKSDSTIIVSISIGFGANNLFIALHSGLLFPTNDFMNTLRPYLEMQEEEVREAPNLAVEGIGCWHPVFPARSDDVWLAAATAVKAIDRYCEKDDQKTCFLVYTRLAEKDFEYGYNLTEIKYSE